MADTAEAPFSAAEQLEHQGVIPRGFDHEVASGLEDPIHLPERPHGVVDVLDHVVQQDHIERRVGQAGGLEDRVLDLEPQFFPGVAAGLIERLHAHDVPAVFLEDVKEIAQAATDFEQPAALGIKPVQQCAGLLS